MVPVTFPFIEDYLNYYSPNEVLEITNSLQMILKKYDSIVIKPGMLRRLTDYRSTLLKLLLNNMITAETSYHITTLTKGTYKSFDELSSLYDLVREYKRKYQHKDLSTSTEKLLEITFKYPGKKLTIKDRKMTDWVNEQLLHEIDQMNLPSSFGLMRFLARANDNEEVLTMLKEKGESKSIPRGRVIFLYCQSIITYMNKNLSLRNDSNYLTDDLVKLLYELLMIMKVEDTDLKSFNYERDYPSPSKVDKLRRLLNNHHDKELKDRGTRS